MTADLQTEIRIKKVKVTFSWKPEFLSLTEFDFKATANYI